jgi:hypothetical protein
MRIKSIFTHSAQAIAEGALISLLVVGLIAGTAFAARGGGATGGTSSSATLSTDCNSCALGTVANFSGTGLDGSQPRGLVAVTTADGSTAWAGINVNSDGTTSFVWYMNPGGAYTFKVYQTEHKKQVLMATLTGVVVQ